MCGRHVSLTPEQLRYVNLVKNLGVITVGCDGGLKLQSIDYDKQQRLSVWKGLGWDALILHCQGRTIGRKQSNACKYVEYIVSQFTDLNATDGSLCREIWFNNKQLCIYASTASQVATPAETLTANLGETL